MIKKVSIQKVVTFVTQASNHAATQPNSESESESVKLPLLSSSYNTGEYHEIN
jgi:hypothetical protein